MNVPHFQDETGARFLDIQPGADGPTKFLDGSFDMPIAYDQ